ncbi:cob(I)yrinic acid a,c-diamide adenosyltransferase [Candidatus Woesearchaeota archaeon]|nr:cob(I)yrinic acid a,c-diamide adenosyltransferase [Candidatus Woesearchaeota archaeon]
MALYTGKGDNGTTCLLGKTGVEKDDDRIEALGTYDELNSVIGVVGAFAGSDDTVRILKSAQDDIHTICAELGAAVETVPKITEKHVERIEKIIAECERFVEPQHSFLLPGGSKEAALLHLSRTVSRRAERQLVRLAKSAEVNPLLLKYANRLSSLLHIMARVENRRRSITEEKPNYEYWKR